MFNYKEHLSNKQEKYKFEDLDLDKLTIETEKQFLQDLSYCRAEDKPMLDLNFALINRLPLREFEEHISDNPKVQKYFYNINIDDKIEDAYQNIIENFNSNEKPIITVDFKYLQEILYGIKSNETQKTYDGQKIIAGTIGRPPLKSEERIVCRINNINPSDIVPRSTGKNAKEFIFNGVVIFKKFIEPENIEIISMPKNLMPKNINLPINLVHFAKLLKLEKAA